MPDNTPFESHPISVKLEEGSILKEMLTPMGWDTAVWNRASWALHHINEGAG